MARIVVVGGSVIGSLAALLLARDGHDVTVLERDDAPPPASPGDAWDDWDRAGVPQFRQPHNVFPRLRLILEAELPDVLEDMKNAGLHRWDYLAQMPPFVRDRSPREGDERFWCYTGRRPVVENVLARAVQAEGNVDVRRGVRVEGLVAGSSAQYGVPHVAGVRTHQGEQLTADLVVDATGRRTQLADWLQSLGGRPPHVESEDSGFTYYTRYFTGPELPATRGRVVVPLGTFSLLTLPGDNDTWSVTLWVASHDRPMKELRHAEKFTKVVASCPMHKHWLDGKPITDIVAMSGILDSYRRFVVDGQPVATGIAAVGDAWASTNPSAGRGISVGAIHAQHLRDVVRSSLDSPALFAHEWDAVTQTQVAPFYWNQIRADRARIAEMDALRAGAEPPTPDPLSSAAATAMLYDPDVFRGQIEIVTCLALPDEVFARDGMLQKIEASSAGRRAPGVPGPKRDELLALVS